MLLALLKPFALASTLALTTLGLFSRRSRRARYAFHLTLYAGTLGFMSVAGVFISLAASVVKQVSVCLRLGPTGGCPWRIFRAVTLAGTHFADVTETEYQLSSCEIVLRNNESAYRNPHDSRRWGALEA
jgi:hypothetical protein